MQSHQDPPLICFDPELEWLVRAANDFGIPEGFIGGWGEDKETGLTEEEVEPLSPYTTLT